MEAGDVSLAIEVQSKSMENTCVGLRNTFASRGHNGDPTL
jgi:hypothetical protein